MIRNQGGKFDVGGGEQFPDLSYLGKEACLSGVI